MDSKDVAAVLGAFTTAITVGSTFLYTSYRRLKNDTAKDKRDKSADDTYARTISVIEQAVKQWQTHAANMERLADEAESRARRDRRLRMVAEERLARVQKQAADDREADRREVERLNRRILDLETQIGNRRKTDRD